RGPLALGKHHVECHQPVVQLAGARPVSARERASAAVGQRTKGGLPGKLNKPPHADWHRPTTSHSKT
ncbi:MAG: hypothetical protein D6706_08730, partial [Chloroflexi bacterium]